MPKLACRLNESKSSFKFLSFLSAFFFFVFVFVFVFGFVFVVGELAENTQTCLRSDESISSLRFLSFLSLSWSLKVLRMAKHASRSGESNQFPLFPNSFNTSAWRRVFQSLMRGMMVCHLFYLCIRNMQNYT